MATITFDQVGLSAGVTDRARSDGLATGAQVTVTVAPGGGAIEFVDIPPGDSSVLSGGPTVWTFNPTSSIYGTWLVRYTESGVVTERAFSVRTPIRGLRIPAFNEKASLGATVANGASHIADSGDNEGGSYNGWTRTIRELYEQAETGVDSSEVSTTPTASLIPRAGGSGKISSGWTSLTQVVATGPTTSNPGVNSLVLASVSGGAVTVNLPAGHVVGDAMTVKLTSVATNTCTLDPNGAETIDGASTLILSNDFEWATLISNGTNWFQIG